MFNLPLTSCRFKPRGLCHGWLVHFVYKLHVLIRYNKNFRNYWLMTTQPDRYQTNVSPGIYQTLRTNNKTNFEKLLGQRVSITRQLQSVSIFFKFVDPYLLKHFLWFTLVRIEPQAGHLARRGQEVPAGTSTSWKIIHSRIQFLSFATCRSML